MAKASLSEKSKSDLVRDFVSMRPNSTAKEIVAGVKREYGADVSLALASKIKSDAGHGRAAARSEQPAGDGSKATRRKRRRRRRTAATAEAMSAAPGSLSIENLIAAKKLADHLGSVAAAKQAVDALAATRTKSRGPSPLVVISCFVKYHRLLVT